MARYFQYGGIPNSEIYSKFYESTDLDEAAPEHQLDDYNRATLKDLRPDEPLWESDKLGNGGFDPRTGETRGGGSYSRSVLSRHHGGRRNNATPEMPDGSFIDHEFLIRDPRSIMQGPDMTKLAEQTWKRGRLFKMHNDDDLSVPGSGINAKELVRNIRQGAFRLGRERIKIFGTSKDNFGVAALPRFASGAGGANHYEFDGVTTTVDTDDSHPRTNATTVLSNEMAVGWASVPDHEFKVAHYGDMRRYPSIATANFGKNRQYSQVDDSALPVNYRDQIVSKSLALTMADVARRRATNTATADGTTWAESAELANRDRMFDRDQASIGGAIRAIVQQSAVVTDPGYEQANSQRQLVSKLTEVMFNSEMTPAIAEWMEMAAQNRRAQKTSDDAHIRQQIETTTLFGTETMAATRRLEQRGGKSTLGKTAGDQDVAQGLEVHNYAGYAPVRQIYKDTAQATHEFSDTGDQKMYKSGTLNRAATIDDYQVDNPTHSSTEQFFYGDTVKHDVHSSRRDIAESHLLGSAEL